MRLILSLCLLPALVAPASAAPLIGRHYERSLFPNPYAHIPAQCYIETAEGTQNACAYCHNDGLAGRNFGNNAPQGGAHPFIGDLTAEYAFAAVGYPINLPGSIMPWRNTLEPEALAAEMAQIGAVLPADMTAHLREDNWTPAAQARPGDPRDWDSGAEGHPLRLFPALHPADLPAGPDGFVRSARGGIFRDGEDWITGWRAINFTPYGIFTPLTGSVSGIYIRLPAPFMQNAAGAYDLGVYAANLDLLSDIIQDRPRNETHYLGAAASYLVEPGLYPQGTEFAHPLHYVDIAADGQPDAPARFPGARANRVKEIRWMYKSGHFDPNYGHPGTKEEDAPAYANRAEGWIDNGAGWILAGWIEDANGALRPQTPSELVQCVGCHSGHMPQPETGGYPDFQSGVSLTVDSTWALPRRHNGPDGWAEMDVMGYLAPDPADPEAVGTAQRGDPVNRKFGTGEFAHFLREVVGVSLYGDMPASVESWLAETISTARGYSHDWPALPLDNADAYNDTQKMRAALLAELTQRGEHLTPEGKLHGALLYPNATEAQAGAMRYQQVVATQSYDFGKDVFADTPITLRYFRRGDTAFTHLDGHPYQVGEIITDRAIDEDPVSLTYGIGIVPTLLGETPDYEPLLD